MVVVVYESNEVILYSDYILFLYYCFLFLIMCDTELDPKLLRLEK